MIKSPHKRHKGFKKIREGLSALRKARNAKGHKGIRDSWKSIDGLNVRGAEQVRKGLDLKRKRMASQYLLNRVR